MPTDQELEATQDLVVDLVHLTRARDPDNELSAGEIARRCGVHAEAVEAVLSKLRRRDVATIHEGDDGWTVGA